MIDTISSFFTQIYSTPIRPKLPGPAALSVLQVNVKPNAKAKHTI